MLEPDPEAGVRIPPERLPAATLRGIIEEFVTRDGTDLADAGTKIAQVEAAVARGAVEVWFDAETRTCNLVPVEGV